MRFVALVLLLVSHSQAASISATPQPGMVHVVVDVCPDAVTWATEGSGKPLVKLLSDDVWISTPSLWLFHMNETGSYHTFDLSANLIGLHPSLYAEDDGSRFYAYTHSYGSYSTSDTRQLASASLTSVVPEPSAALLSLLAVAGLLRLSR